MEKKNIAILLSGLHYSDCNNSESTIINFKNYSENIKSKIYDYFNNNYNIDTFICTNKSNIFFELIKTYLPVKFFIENSGSNNLKRLEVLKLLINYINETNKQYDLIILTSFDITIINELNNISFDVLNIINVLNSNFKLTKDLFIFPIKYLNNFLDILKTSLNKNNDNFFINELKKYSEIERKKPYVILPAYKITNSDINTAILFHVGNINIFYKIYQNYTNFFNRDLLIFISLHNSENSDYIHNYLPNAYITIIENRGLDIGGNLNNMKLLINHPNYKNIENIYFLHTKTYDPWREDLYLPLANNFNQIELIIKDHQDKPVIIGSSKYCFRNKPLNRIYINDILNRNKEISEQMINNWEDYFDEYIFEDNSSKDEKNIYIDLKINPEFYKNYENGLQNFSNDLALNHFKYHGKNECYRISNPCYIKKFAKESYFIAGTVFLCNKEYFKIFENINFEYEYNILENGYVLNYIPRKTHAWEYLYGLLAYTRNGYIISVDTDGKTEIMIDKDKEFNFEIFKNCNLDLINKSDSELLNYYGIRNRIYCRSQIYKNQAIINIDLLKATIAVFMVIPSEKSENCEFFLNYIKESTDSGNNIDIYFGYDDNSIKCFFGLSIIDKEIEEIYKLIDSYNILDINKYNFYLGYNLQKFYDVVISNSAYIKDALYSNKSYCKNIIIK